MTWLLSFLTGPILRWAGDTALDFYKSKLAAANTQDKMAVELAVKEIEAEIVSRAEATKVMLIESGRWWTAMPRALVQWSLAIHITAVVFTNTTGWGSIPAIGGDIGNWFGMIMAFWFGGRTLEKCFRIFKR
jgi:hypothetical protein